jgi:hypothetical protein
VPISLVGGVVPAAFVEDSNTDDAVLHYGHRTDANQPTNRYIDAAGGTDEANGCRYFASDSPGGIFGDCLPGDSYDFILRFRGEIRRNGRVIQTKTWTAMNLVNWQP